jgi:hypothetical protein
MIASARSVASRVLATRRSGAGAGAGAPEGGFALMLVLGVIGLTAVVVVALLGLAITSARVTAMHRETAREQRAAVGALESALGQMARRSGIDPCDALPAEPADTRLVFDTVADGTGIPVEVTCSAAPWVPPAASVTPVEPRLESRSPAPNVVDGNRYRFAEVTCTTWDCRTPPYLTTWSAAGAEPLRSAHLLFQSDEGENVHNLNRRIHVNVTPAAGSGHPPCRVNVTGGRTNHWVSAFTSVDLFSSEHADSTCRTVLNGVPQSVFDGATISVTHQYISPSGTPSGCSPRCAAVLTIGDFRLLTNVSTFQGSAAAAVQGAWTDPGGITRLDGSLTQIAQTAACRYPLFFVLFPGGDHRCVYEREEQTFALSVSNFSPTVAGLHRPDEELDSLGVLIDSRRSNPVVSWISDPLDETWFEVQLSVPGRGTCTVRQPGFSRSNQQVYVDLFGQAGCRTQARTVADLAGASVTYTLRSNCLHWGLVRAEVTDGRCDSVRVPEFDRVALMVRTPPTPDSSIATLTAQVAERAVARVEVLISGEAALPRPVPVIGWTFCQGEVCGPAAAG